MAEKIKLVECPRDGWQGLHAEIPTRQKADYLRKLIAAGFTHIDAVSFVSAAAVPQMADSEAVLRLLGPHPNVEIIAIVVNEKGAERAIATGAVSTLGFPYSISPGFLRRNQNQTQAESLRVLQSIAALARTARLDVVAYVSMAFGNPYNEPWDIDMVADAVSLLTECGINQISLADTVGIANPDRISEALTAAMDAQPTAEIGVHLHARPAGAADKIRAAYRAGCRRFDSAIGGLGGCPFAQDDLVGNIATETLIAELSALNADLPALGRLHELVEASAQLAKQFSMPGGSE